MTFRRCREVSFDGIKKICYDGEIVEGESINAKIVPSALLYTPAKPEWII